MGGKLLGWRTRCAVEIDPYARSILLARQRDGCLPRFPIWDDIKTFAGQKWRGHIDVISGGFPCQDISCANSKAQGITGERSGLWMEMARVIDEVGPRYVFVENAPMLTSRGLGRVLGDLADMGYDARWGVLGAHCAGLDHPRQRLWIVADSLGFRSSRWPHKGEGCNAEDESWSAQGLERLRESRIRYDIPAPDAFGIANGMAHRVDRLRAIGNGQVPAVARIAYELLSRELHT